MNGKELALKQPKGMFICHLIDVTDTLGPACDDNLLAVLASPPDDVGDVSKGYRPSFSMMGAESIMGQQA